MEVYFHELHKDVLVLAVDGGLDAHTSRQFTERVQAVADTGVKKIIVDCSKLSYLSSTGIAALLLLHKRMTARGSNVKIAGARSGIIDVLRLTRLDGVLELYPDVERAALGFKPEDAGADAAQTLDKPTLRALMRLRLGEMPAARRADASERLIARLLESELLPGPDAGAVMLYASSPALGEPDLDALIGALIERGYRVGVPRVDVDARAMTCVAIRSAAELVENPSRPVFREAPAEAGAIDAGELGAVVVPGLAFDASLRRLGRGAGFYDRFLERLDAEKPRRISLAFDEQIVERVPVDEHDQPLHAVVTPTRVLV
jgi:5-formyltetrahydrofolate cyclo-ligase